MSSLRLALKQSLEEAGPLNKKQSRSRSSRSRGGKRSENRRKKRRGGGDSPKHKRGRCPHESDSDEEGNQDHSIDKRQDHSSSEEENEFSAGEQDDDDGDDDSEGSEAASRQSEEEGEEEQHNSDNHSSREDHTEEEEGEEIGPKSSAADDQHVNDLQRKLNKKLKHSAANKIQNQWKKKKEGSFTNGEDNAIQLPQEDGEEPKPTIPVEQPESDGANQGLQEEKGGGESSHTGDVKISETEVPPAGDKQKKKKNKGSNERGGGKGKTAKTVPPPNQEVLEWNRALPVKRARKNVTQGLRVKVRFATKIKREGKILRKKKWFGGRVSAVSKEGSKIRIKYDDGTAEISKFPDKDVVVDDAFNGEHQANASKFQPPEHDNVNVMHEGELGAPPEENAEKEVQAADEAKNKESGEEEERTGESPDTEEVAMQLCKNNDNYKEVAETEKPSESIVIRSPSPQLLSMVEEPMRPPSPPIPMIEMAAAAPLIDSQTQQTVAADSPAAPPPHAASPVIELAATLAAVPQSLEHTEKSSTEKETPAPIPNNAIIHSADTKAAESTKTTSRGKSSGEINVSAPVEGDRKTEESRADQKLQSSEATIGVGSRNDDSNGPTTQGGKEREEEKVAAEARSTSDKAVQQRPSLTIRLANPKRERRGSGSEQKSPRIKINKRVLLGDDTSMQPLSLPILQATAPSAAPTINVSEVSEGNPGEKDGVDLKRRRKDDEEHMLTKDAFSEPPAKRFQLQPPSALQVTESATLADADAGTRQQEDDHPAEKTKISSPDDPQTRIDTLSGTSHGEDNFDNNDNDDGPVKLVSGLPARGVQMSLEEDRAKAESSKSEERQESKSRRPQANAQEGVETKRPQAMKVRDAKSISSPISENADDVELKKDKDKILLSDANSAFERKESAQSELAEDSKSNDCGLEEEGALFAEGANAEEENLCTGPASSQEKAAVSQVTQAARSGRRAAEQANKRMATKPEAEKEKEKGKDEKEQPAASKKRKKKDRPDEDSESSNEDDNNWVQCDSCKKWRIIPNHIKISSLPERWYCHLNDYDTKRNFCDAPEVVIAGQINRAPVAKKKRRGRKKLRQRTEAADSASVSVPTQTNLSRNDSQQSLTTKEKRRVKSPIPQDDTGSKAKEKDKESARPKDKGGAKSKDRGTVWQASTAGAKSKHPRASPNSVSGASTENSCTTQSNNKPSKKSKQEKKTKRVSDEPLEPIDEAAPTELKGKLSRGKTSKGPKEPKESSKDSSDHDQNNGSVHGSVCSQQNDQEPENVEWVQCDSCAKWRRIPAHVSADELPDVWYCNMNTWNPGLTCEIEEDSVDPGQQDVGPSQYSSGAGKLSYRNLIFGSGRKINRRSCPSESIFATPSDDSECGYPTVMYANSSAFAPRGSRANIIEDDHQPLSVFDLMHHSNLFAELRGSKQEVHSQIDSTRLGARFASKYFFETIPRNLRQHMKDMILKVLPIGSGTLLGEEVALLCSGSQWDNSPPAWEEARAYCNKDSVITLLCELVTEGRVELVQGFGVDWTVKDWNPRYRLVENMADETTTYPEPVSRCMKIAKPWKQK